MSEGPFPSGSCPLHGTNRRTIAGSNNLEKLYLAGEFGGNYRFVKRKIPAGHHTHRGFVLKEEKLSDYFALRQARLAAGLVSQEAASASVRIARMNHRSLAKPLRNSSN